MNHRLPFPNARRLAFILLAIALGLMAALIFIELAVRVAGLAPKLPTQYAGNVADDTLPYFPEPDSERRGEAPTGEFNYHYEHNRFGFRDVDHPTTKPADIFRVLALGDSFTYGVGADFEQTYLARLEKLLNDRAAPDAQRVEIVKAGIPRYFPEPQRLLLEKYGSLFQPDLVMVAFVPNDVIETYLGLGALVVDPATGYLMTREAEALGPALLKLYRWSHAARLVLGKAVAWQLRRNYPVEWDAIYEENGAHESAWREVEQQYAKIAELTRELGARFAIVHIPQQPPWSPNHAYPAERLRRFAENHNGLFIDTLPALRAAQTTTDTPLYYAQDGHCTPAGYAVIANHLADELSKLTLLPNSP